MPYFQDRPVLVTGGAGLIGQETVVQLLDRGARVRATVYRERTLAISHPRLETVTCDLAHREDCARVVRDMEVVIHAAGYVRGVKGQRNAPADVIMNNLLPAVNVLDASCREGVDRVGWIGSGTVYPDTPGAAREEDAFAEEPLSRYFGIGWLYRYCEKLCRYFHEAFPTDFAMIRAATVYGPHERFTVEDGHVLPALIIKAANRVDPFPVWGDGTDVRDFVYVGDLVGGLLTAVERHAVADPINIGSGVGHTINDVLRIILEYVRHSPRIAYQAGHSGPSRPRVLDITEAKRILGFEATTSLEAGLRTTIDWYRSTLTS